MNLVENYSYIYISGNFSQGHITGNKVTGFIVPRTFLCCHGFAYCYCYRHRHDIVLSVIIIAFILSFVSKVEHNTRDETLNKEVDNFQKASLVELA